jgi:hypothetical protein
MKKKSFPKLLMYVTLCFTLIFALVLMAGCEGDTGATGAAGPAGPAGPVTATNETCNVCHSAGSLADTTATRHPDMYTTKLVVSNLTLASVAGVPQISFHVDTDTNGVIANYTTLAKSAVRVYMSDLVPAGTVTTGPAGTISSDYFETWLSERDTTAGTVFNTSDAANGNYVWTCSTAFGVPTNADLNTDDIDVTVGTGHTQRLALRLSAPSTPIGSIGDAATLDFKVPAAGTNAVALADQKMFVTIETCNKCHGPAMAGAAHGSGYLDTKVCILCHSPLYAANATDETVGFMLGLQADFPEFIHKIHAAKAVAGFPTRISGNGYVDVTYPQDVKKCDVCHSDPGGTGADPVQLAKWKTHPTRIACGGCHDTVNWTTGANHSGGPQADDASCSACHHADTPGLAQSVTAAHDTTIAAGSANDPEYDVTLTMTPPAGTSYARGEAVDITVTLVDRATGNPVAGTVYTTARDAAGVAGGGLRVASLYVYGPRSKALPMTGTQAISLFTGGTDPNVTTDATGFKYHLVIPSSSTTTPNGTYMVRFRAGDYSRVSDTDYKIESLAFQRFQIGTTTVQPKIDGDACVNCHGTGTAPFHDARHAVVFDSDECVSCHDLSGGHAAPLDNRVHAVHAQSALGDQLLERNWSTVTYSMGDPGTSSSGASTGAKICTTCHTTTNTAYKSPSDVRAWTCAGCHADNTVSLDHMKQNGAPERVE